MNLFNIKKTFEMKRVKNWPEIYWCIDLHGTIIPSGSGSDDKTDKLELYPYSKEVLQFISKRKDMMMILWTSTPADRIGNVWNFLNSNGIYFDYLNQNPHALKTPRSDFDRKFYFSILLDDRSSFDPLYDWIMIARQLELSIKDSIIEWNDINKKNLQMAISNSNVELNDLIIFN